MKTINVVAAIILRTTTDALTHTTKTEVFATQRGYGEFKDGWEFPGGKIEPNETPQSALAREIREELATELSIGEKLDTIEYNYPTFHLSMQCFVCKILSGKLELLEHENSAWLDASSLMSVDWLPADIQILSKVKSLLLTSKQNNIIFNTTKTYTQETKLQINIRNEKPQDYKTVEALVRKSFWNVYKPGCDEHVIVNKLRTVKEFIPELDFIAEVEGKIVGQVMSSFAKIVNENGEDTQNVICIGPIGVLPEFQGKAIGSALMQQTIETAKKMGFKGIVLYGNPAFYSRFGFEDAKKYKITMPDGNNIPDFMAIELSKNSLNGITGKCYESDVFVVSKEELAEFEKQYF